MVRPQSVSEFIANLKNHVEHEFRSVWISGEVTNFSNSSSGHYYFNLSDAQALISVAVFKMDALRNPLIRSLKNGDQIECLGEVSLYPKRGSLQIIARKILKAGEGDQARKFEELKNKLMMEGLFDPSIKKKIPVRPKNVGLITAISSAAIADFLTVCRRRGGLQKILISESLMQGEKALPTLIAAYNRLLSYHNEKVPLDLIVICRGGGSSEDLSVFNEESFVRLLSNSPVPIVSAIGHEVDFTLTDFVADLRAETPSAAAELVTVDLADSFSKLNSLERRLRSSLSLNMTKADLRLKRVSITRLKVGLLNLLERHKTTLKKFKDITRYSDQVLKLTDMRLRMEECEKLLTTAPLQKIKNLESSVETMGRILQNLNPDKTLERGYTYIIDESGAPITSLTSFKTLPDCSMLSVVFKDGKAHVKKH